MPDVAVRLVSGDLTGIKEAPFAPSSLNEQARTVEAVLSTGALVLRSAPSPEGYLEAWWEDLAVAGADLARMVGGPVLVDHRATTDSLVGAVEACAVRAGQIVAKIRFGSTERSEQVLGQVRDGILRGLSLGYRVRAWQAAGAGQDGRPVYRATDWQPLEVSFVPIPADPGATVRAGLRATPSTSTEENTMTSETGTVPGSAATAQSGAEVIDTTRAAELQRVRGIRAAGGGIGVSDADVLDAISEGLSLEQAQRRFTERVAQEQRHAGIHTMPRGGVDFFGVRGELSPDQRIEHAAEALACRVTGKSPSERARAFMGGSIATSLRHLAEARGERVRRNESDAELIQRVMTTSDLPQLLTGAMRRILQARLDAAPGALRTIAARRTVSDFREFRFLQFAGIKQLEKIVEGGPIPMSPPAERGERAAVATYGVQLQITRQALVNDDLSALDQVNLFSNGVMATEAAEFVKMFATNGAGWGPTLVDGLPLFHASHGNVSTGAVGTSGLSLGRVVMRAQTDANGNLVAPAPRYVLVGPSAETAAEQALNETAVVSTTEANRPVFAGRLDLAVEPRLSGVPWFMFADPNQAPVIALVTLEGSNGNPTITQHDKPGYDGLTWKLVHDFAVAPMGYVGAVRLTGAA